MVGRDIGVENYHPPENVYGIIANPPCTMFSVARTNAKTPRDFIEGMRLVKECLRIIWECQYPTKGHRLKSNLKFWVIENPATGALKNFLGNPNYTYSPHEFGADFSKKTALWGLFNKPNKPYPNAPKLRHCIRSDRLAQTLLSFTHIDKCLHTKSRLLFPIQQPFVELMLRTAILPLLPIPDTHSKIS